jgi:transcriptional regulator with XRE-family HTH domain
MSEPFKNKRIKFNKKGVQKKFILEARELLNMSGLKLAQKLDINQRTLSDWIREKFSMPYDCAQKISKLAKISIPSDYYIFELKDHLRKIGKIGGKNRIILYRKIALNEEYRNKKWQEWWREIGQYKKKPKGFKSLVKIKIPGKDEKLAEFTGVMLGDGGIAPYHVHITLSNKEKEYANYLINLINKLFGIKPKIYKIKKAKAIDIVVQRKNLVDFCQKIGLVLGNKVKKQVDIPEWVKENKNFSKACIRGLIDTDGCFYINSYYVNNKKYLYFKIAFTNGSKPLVLSVFRKLKDLGINSRVSKNYKDVRIESRKHVLKYIEEIGSNNHKHLQKIEKWKKSNNMLK